MPTLMLWSRTETAPKLLAGTGGSETGSGYDVGTWSAGALHMVTATWSDGVSVLYIDGASVATQEYPGTLDIGADAPLPLNGDIMDVALYRRSVPTRSPRCSTSPRRNRPEIRGARDRAQHVVLLDRPMRAPATRR